MGLATSAYCPIMKLSTLYDQGERMLRNSGIFLAGLLTGLLSSAVLLLVISEPRGIPIELLPPPTPESLRIHVAGAVTQPGVYTLPVESIVAEAITAAGGPLDEAILDMVNMAAVLEDGQQIFVPAEADTSSETYPSDPIFVSASAEKININTATASELETLPGIGPSLAKKIVEFRETHGPFLKVEDLLNVSGIGPSKFEGIQDLITIR
jgi:competence protein ComEA